MRLEGYHIHCGGDVGYLSRWRRRELGVTSGCVVGGAGATDGSFTVVDLVHDGEAWVTVGVEMETVGRRSEGGEVSHF